MAVGIKEYAEQQDTVEQIIHRNGRTMRRKTKKVNKNFLTIGGEITIARHVYQADDGGACYVPLDHAIGTAGQYALPDVREAIAYMSSHLIPREVSQIAKRFSMFHPSEKAMVGTVSFYTEKTVLKDGKATKEPERMYGIYTARMPEERFPTFKSKLEREVRIAESRLAPESTKIVLMDGARGLWKYVEDSPLFDGYEMLLDFYHMTEHLSRLSEALFGKSKEGAQKWYQQYRDKIKHNPTGVVAMLRSVKYHQGKLRDKKLSKCRRDSIRRECTFFQNNQHRMSYACFLENAWPIGSGPTESGCKTLVKQRLCRSGMRWTRQGGQPILSLRSIVKSNRWDALWKQYVAQLTPCAT